jgi:hypothetical protein
MMSRIHIKQALCFIGTGSIKGTLDVANIDPTLLKKGIRYYPSVKRGGGWNAVDTVPLEILK